MFPEISNENIVRVCKLLGLPEIAFHGADGQDPRQDVLKSHDTIDINACPGSGKTTLLVAKLALLAKNWPHRTRGICVLSHTNAAREEIEKKLGVSTEGKILLGYPHFIGTIHRFIDQFLAIPFLRSIGCPPSIIDTDFTLDWRWRNLTYASRSALTPKLDNSKSKNFLEMKVTDGTVGDIPWGKGGILNRESSTYKDIVSVNKLSIKKGFLTFNEMFLFAKAAIANRDIVDAISFRFPYLFIDEAQDNSELQSSLINKIFCILDGKVIRQRFGDANQAIYSYAGQTGAETDPFPFTDKEKVKELPNSHRFGQEMANLANHFTADPIAGGLLGEGPNLSRGEPQAAGRHTLILFDEDTITDVLPTFSKIVLAAYENTPDRELGDFVAVGAVHNQRGKKQNAPHSVKDYYPKYDSRLSNKDTKPDTFLEYVYKAKNTSQYSGLSFNLVESFNEAILRCLQIAGGDVSGLRKKRKCKFVRGMLGKSTALHETLMLVVVKPSCHFDEKSWKSRWVGAIKFILRDIDHSLDLNTLSDFLEWTPGQPKPLSRKQKLTELQNVFVYKGDGDEQISIRLGSIHSIKGQTHTATLVLDTFNRTYHFKKLTKCVKQETLTPKQRAEMQARMRLHYVAATRPTHLLCLASRKDHFNEKEINSIIESGNWKVTILENAE
jgi:hypothetical protein